MQCPRCGNTSSDQTGFFSCPLCGFPLITGSISRGSSGPRGYAPLEAEKGGGNPLAAMVITLYRSFSETDRFFAAIAANRPLMPAFVYGLVLGSIGILASFLWKSVFPLSFSAIIADANVFSENQNGFSAIALIAAPVMIAMQLFLFAIFAHAMLYLTRSRRRTFSVTFKTVCYAQGALIFQIIPFFGTLASFFAWFYLIVSGIHTAHGMSRGRAFAVVTLPILLLCAAIAVVVLFSIIVLGLVIVSQIDFFPFFRR